VATCFGRIAAIFRPAYTDRVPSMCVQYVYTMYNMYNCTHYGLKMAAIRPKHVATNF